MENGLFFCVFSFKGRTGDLARAFKERMEIYVGLQFTLLPKSFPLSVITEENKPLNFSFIPMYRKTRKYVAKLMRHMYEQRFELFD